MHLSGIFNWGRQWRTALSRRKDNDDATKENETKLARVLGLVDLTALGVGATLGLGVYVLAGAVAKSDSGPAVTLSFLIAAIASAFAALCYAEFASRVPKAGSAYIYSYVTVGEFAAFVIGWNLILEYAIGTASVAKGFSNYVDVLLGNVMKNTMRKLLPIEIGFLAPYPDFFACSIVFLLTGLLAWGVKESTMFNNAFTIVNLITVSIVIISGLFKVNPKNWAIPKNEIPANVNGGEGGFMPFGWVGVMSGAAKCFYGFVGFDAVAATGEEAKKPKKHIPLSIIFSLIIIFVSYFGVATVLTMMTPYYDQDSDAPLPHVFDQVGWHVVKWIVTGGAVCALCTSMLGAVFPLPRILYAMSIDGLLFRTLSEIHPKTQTPLFATMISGLLAGVMAGIFNLEQLIDMMSIGTLLAYTIVAICILVLRYREDETIIQSTNVRQFANDDHSNIATKFTIAKLVYIFRRLFNTNGMKYPTPETRFIAHKAILLFSLISSLLCFSLVFMSDVTIPTPISRAINITLVIFCLVSIVILNCQPQAISTNLPFKVPMVPFIPCCSILINLLLMLKLDINTWIRFTIWLIIGFLIYVFYGMDHSVQGIQDNMELKITKGKPTGYSNKAMEAEF